MAENLHFPEDCDDIDRAFISSIGGIPDSAVIEGMVVVLSWIDPNGLDQRWMMKNLTDLPVSQIVGLLEMSKLEAIARCAGAVTNLSGD